MRTPSFSHRARLLAVVALGAVLLASPARGKDEAPVSPPRHAYRGEVVLEVGGDAELALDVGDRLKGKTKIHVIDWFGGHAISGQVDVENPTDATVHFGYHVAFFDAEGGLVGCANQSMDVEGGARVTVGGAVIKLPREAIGTVRRYQIAWYEDAQEIGKR